MKLMHKNYHEFKYSYLKTEQNKKINVGNTMKLFKQILWQE